MDRQNGLLLQYCCAKDCLLRQYESQRSREDCGTQIISGPLSSVMLCGVFYFLCLLT